MPKTKTRSDYSDVTIRGLINFAFKDYIAARTLLRNRCPSQGTVLAIMSLEKLLKAISLLMNESIVVGGTGHGLSDMVDTMNSNDAGLLTDADVVFIKYINEGYVLRYPDNIDKSFRIYLPAMRILENLDRVFCKLIESTHVHTINPDGKLYDVYKGREDNSLIDQNVHFDLELTNTLSESRQRYIIYKGDIAGFSFEECWTRSVKHNSDWDTDFTQ